MISKSPACSLGGAEACSREMTSPGSHCQLVAKAGSISLCGQLGFCCLRVSPAMQTGGWAHLGWREAPKGTLGDKNVLYLDWGSCHTTDYICQKGTLERVKHLVCKLYLNNLTLRIQKRPDVERIPTEKQEAEVSVLSCFYLVQRGYDYMVNCSNNSTAQFFTFHGFAFICIISLYVHNNSPQGSKE